MRHLRLWTLLLGLLTALVASAAKPELSVPSIHVGKSVYSNAVITASGTNRISVEHPHGLASLKIADLEVELAQQLLAAGVLTEQTLKANTRYQAHLKAEQKAAKERERARNPQGPVAQYAGMEGSMGAQLGQRLEKAAGAGGRINPDKYVAMLGFGVVISILSIGILFHLLRCWCFFRIVRKSLGHGSLLVFLPLLQWLPLIKAAGMSRGWLWMPAFGLAMAYYQPPFPEEAPWAGQVYFFVTIGFVAVSALLFLIWCFKICRVLGSSPWLGLLLVLPLLELIPLLYLAFGEGAKSEPNSKSKVGSNRPAFAV